MRWTYDTYSNSVRDLSMTWMLMEGRAYWILFTAGFIGIAIWESLRPKRMLSGSLERRWGNHGIVLVACTLAGVAVYRISPVVMAITVGSSRFGLLNRPTVPFVARCLLTLLALDLTKYALHRACHSVRLLWRVHQVHHSDPDFDVSTAFRHHPGEIIFMQGAYLAAIAVLAPPATAVLVAELASSIQSFVMHANASLPGWVEKSLRPIYITPDLHRIHHSAEICEQSRNLGDILPWWDRLFGTYLAEPAAGQEGIVIGLKGVEAERSLSPAFMLASPFRPLPGEMRAAELPIADV
jgi:sterol desaturase/sphingolipid hydroxylase (fatty acid hydroxylase superfamily)